jgi:hypothetical protein
MASVPERSAHARGASWAETLAVRLVSALEPEPEPPLAPKKPLNDLEAELLQGGCGSASAARSTPSSLPSSKDATTELAILRSDFES